MKKFTLAWMAVILFALGCSVQTSSEDLSEISQEVVSSGDLHINEIFEGSAGFVELVNSGTTSIDLSQFDFQTDSDTPCALSGSLAAGAYAYIDDGSCNHSGTCLSCSTGSFGYSSDVREYKLLNASDSSVEESQTYPAAAGGPMEQCSATHRLCGVHPYLTPGDPSYNDGMYQNYCVPTCQSQGQPSVGESWNAKFFGADSMGDPTEWKATYPTPASVNY